MTSHVPASCEVSRRKVNAKLLKIFEVTIECAEKHESAPRQMDWICRGAGCVLLFGLIDAVKGFVEVDALFSPMDIVFDAMSGRTTK